MSENKTIKNFTTADIERYWTNKLSPSEMHEMEKAAMDDPFFADALEGYQNSHNPTIEIAALKERLSKKVKDDTPVIPLLRKKYYWLRVAAAVIILVGTGLAVQQLVFKSKNETPVAVNTNKEEQKVQADKSNQDLTLAPAQTQPASTNTSVEKSEKAKSSVDLNSSYAYKDIDSLKNIVISKKASILKDTSNISQGDVRANVNDKKKDVIDDKSNAVLNEVVVAPQANNNTDKETIAKPRAFAQNAKSKGIELVNKFNYRIVDAQNNPVPFANVTNTRDNVGTYTDIKGYFNLVSSDSILNVQVRSLGFNAENYKLIPSNKTNNLVLKEDASAGLLMTANQGRQRVMSSAMRKDSADVVEPEVGWSNYNTYADNNIKIPEKVLTKKAVTNNVELSFDIDKNGTPVNIAVTRSSQCKECDEEAIRLLKEGPKWKKKGKKTKTTISISVDQK